MIEEPKWRVGDVWESPHEHLFLVVEVKPDGIAMLEMFHPFKLRPAFQKLIPENWKRVAKINQ